MNTIWSTYVQNIGTLYDSRSLRFSDFFQSKYKEIFEIEDKKKILEISFCENGKNIRKNLT